MCMVHQINLKDFPGGTRQKLDAACEFCRRNPGTTLFIPAGEYVLEDARALEIMDDLFSGRLSGNPQPIMFNPDYPYTKGLDLTGCRDITVSAYGAILKINGFMEAISVRDAVNTTVAGLTVDHVRKPFTRGRITKIIDGEHAEITFDPLTPPNPDMPALRNFIFNGRTQRIDSYMTHKFDADKVSDLVYNVRHKYDESQTGSDFYFTNTYHFRPCILISHSINTKLVDVTINSQPGMGVVGFKSRDIHILRLHVVPSDGYYMSTNTDATHFSCCSGTVSMENCLLIGHGDDAINIHNYYYRFHIGNKNSAVISTFAPDGTHSQEPDYPLEGYRLQLIDAGTLKPIDQYTVTHSSETEKCEITLDHDLPDEDLSAYYLANITELPKLIFRGNHVRNHLARGVLCKTHNAVIENNYFEGDTGTAVHIAAEAWWGEGITAENVTVRGNCFRDCGCTSYGTTNGASAVSINISAKDNTGIGIYKKITIEDNEVYCPSNAQCAFNIANAKNVTVRNNHIFGVETPIKLEYCENVDSDITL